MSEENVETAIRGFEGIAEGGFDAVWGFLDPGLVWETSPNVPDAGVYEGRERVREFLEEQWEVVWGGLPEIEIGRTFDCGGNDVLLFIRLRGRGSFSEIPIEARVANLVTLRGGKLARVKVIPGRQKALEAAGLSE